MNQGWVHPCVRCGACCAYFRVVFYWREAERATPRHVPGGMTEELDDFRRCMKGTNCKHGIRCAALKGRIGTRVGCTIYENRPSPCRAFAASYENGTKNKRCDEARAAHGLPALRPRDWSPSPEADPAPGWQSPEARDKPPEWPDSLKSV